MSRTQYRFSPRGAITCGNGLVARQNATPQSIEQAMQEFNFMGLLERLDESLVLLQLLLRLQPEHVLYLTAKTSGSYDISNHCRQIPKVEKTPQIQRVLVEQRVVSQQSWRLHVVQCRQSQSGCNDSKYWTRNV